MHLSVEAQEAISRLHTEPHDNDLATLGQELESLFPTYKFPCGLVVQWSDEITPDRLVASRWKQISRIKTGKYHCETALTLETPQGQLIVYHTTGQRKHVPYTNIDFIVGDMDESLPHWIAPQNMGGVWRLMEAAGMKKRVVQ